MEEEAQVMANRKLSFVAKISDTYSGSLPPRDGGGSHDNIPVVEMVSNVVGTGAEDPDKKETGVEECVGAGEQKGVREECLGAGEQKSARELLEGEQECARVLEERLDSELVELNRGADAGTESSKDGVSTAFVLGVGSLASRKVKKVVRKGGKAGMLNSGKLLKGSKGAKRKECMADECDDGFDIRMTEAEIMGKKLKIDDTFDGNVISLTVAEVGVYQPREGQ